MVKEHVIIGSAGDADRRTCCYFHEIPPLGVQNHRFPLRRTLAIMLVSLNEKAFSLISLNHFFIKTYRHYYFAADRERGAWLHSLCWLPPVSSRQSADACLRIRHERIKTARSYACPLLGSRSLSTIIEDHDYGMTGLSVPVYILTSVASFSFGAGT